MIRLLMTGPPRADTTLLLAPGAGAPAASPWMERVALHLSDAGIGARRFDFAYMASRQAGGPRKPPPRADALIGEYEAAAAETAALLGPGARLLIGGKSMGGRVASLAAQALFDAGRIAGLVCLSYPFHPPNRPDQLRTRHLERLTCPTLIVQGERDPFGGRDEVHGYALSPAIAVHWVTDGDHDLTPRKASGATLDGNLGDAAQAVVRFARGLPAASA